MLEPQPDLATGPAAASLIGGSDGRGRSPLLPRLHWAALFTPVSVKA